jgi:hypothetical protein
MNLFTTITFNRNITCFGRRSWFNKITRTGSLGNWIVASALGNNNTVTSLRSGWGFSFQLNKKEMHAFEGEVLKMKIQEHLEQVL